jgi:hypothetical protein
MKAFRQKIPGKFDWWGKNIKLGTFIDALGAKRPKGTRVLESPLDYYGPNRVTLGTFSAIKNSYTRRNQVREEKIYLPLVEQPL